MKTASHRVWALALCLGMLPCACTSLQTEASNWTVAAPPTVTAWVLAEAFRSEFPGADPEPWHRGAPVMALGSNRYVIDYRSRTEHVFRATTNGRLMPPKLRLNEHSATFSESEFVTSGSSTTTASGSQWAILTIRSSIGSSREPHSSIELDLHLDRDHARLRSHVERAIKLLEMSFRTAAEVRQKNWAGLARDLAATLNSNSTACCASHRRLLAPLHIHRATLFHRQSRSQEARLALDRALDLAPQAKQLRIRLARLDEDVAWPKQARDHWIRLAHDGSFGLLRYALAARVQPTAQGLGRSKSQEELARSFDRLDAGDIEGALAWARRARASSTDRSDDLHIAIQIHRRRGDHATAMALGLAQLAEAGEDTRTILDLANDCLKLGEPDLAIRMLARYWTRLEIEAPTASYRALALARARVPEGLALRIVASERVNSLSTKLLAAVPAGQVGQAGESLFQRLADLRERCVEPSASRVIEARPRPSYESAPGISPPR